MIEHIRTIVFAALAEIMVVLLWTSSASAGSIIDQRNDSVSPDLFDSIQLVGPIGQEFVPSLPDIEFADLYLANMVLSGGAQLALLIRESSITGTVIGLSSLANLPDGFFGVTHFSFPSEVPLVPGSLYVMQPIVLSGGNTLVGSTDIGVDLYPPGVSSLMVDQMKLVLIFGSAKGG